MTNTEQLLAELFATMRLMVNERDTDKRRALLGECEYIEAALKHELTLQAIATKHTASAVRLVQR